MELTVVLKGDGSGLTGTMRVSNAELAKLNTTLGETNTRARTTAAGLDTAAAAARRKNSAIRELAAGVNTLRGTLGTLGLGLVARELLTASLASSRFAIGLQASLGSQQQSAQAMAWLRVEADRLGVSLPIMAQGFIGLSASTRGTRLEGQLTRDIFISVVEAGRAMNLSNEQISGTLNALQQIAGKGTVSMEELRQQLGDRLPGAMRLAADAMGMTVGELVKLVSEGKVASDDFLPKFAAALRASAAAGLEASRNSPTAEFTRLRTATFELAAAIGSGGLIQLLATLASGLTDVLTIATALTEGFNQLKLKTLEVVGLDVPADSLIGRLLSAGGEQLKDPVGIGRLADLLRIYRQQQVAAGQESDTAFGKIRANIGSVFDAGKALIEQTLKESEATRKYTADLEQQREEVGATAGELVLLRAQREASTAATELERTAILDAATALKAELDAVDAAAAAKTAMTEATQRNEEETRKAAQAWNNYAQMVTRAAEEERDWIAARREARAEYDRSIRDIRDEIELIGLSGEARRAHTIAIEAERLAHQQSAVSIEEATATYTALLTQLDRAKEIDQARERFERFVDSITGEWADALGQFAVDVLRDVHSIGDAFDALGDSLMDTAKRAVAQMISEFLKLQIINPLLNSIFGTGLQTGGSALGSMFGGGGGAGGGMNWMGMLSSATGNGGGFNLGSLFGGGTGAGGGGIMSSLGGMFGLTGAAGAGNASAMASYGVLNTSTGTASGLMNTGAGGAMQGFARAIPIIGWIIAAMQLNDGLFAQGWRMNSSDMKLPNGATVNGGGGESRAGQFATLGAVGMLDSGLQRLGLSERWASLLSGSSVHARLFGRKAPRLTNSETTFDFSGDTIGGGENYGTIEEGGVFRSDRRRQHQFGLADDAAEVGQALQDSLRTIMREVSQAIASEAPGILDSSLRIVSTYDKKGNVTLTQYIVDVLGRSFTEATQEGASMRLEAEARIAALMPRFADASAIAERWRNDAETLAEGSAFLVAAGADIAAGVGLMGSLEEVVDLVEDMALSGETLADTYLRLAASTQLIEGAFGMMGVAIDHSRIDLIQFAADFTAAAGGVQQGLALWDSYFGRFHTEAERAAIQLDRVTASASTLFTDIGLSLGDFTGSEGLQSFRNMFEEILPTLTAAQVVQWLRAAEALGIVVDAQAFYNQILGETAGTVVGAVQVMSTAMIEAARLTDLIGGMIGNGPGGGLGGAIDGPGSGPRFDPVYNPGAQQLPQSVLDFVNWITTRWTTPDPIDIGGPDDPGTGPGSSGPDLDAEIERRYQMELDWLQRLIALNDSLLLDSQLTTLTSEQRLEEARSQYQSTFVAAMAGDENARANYDSITRTYAEELRRQYGSSDAYTEGFGGIIADIAALIAASPATQAGGVAAGALGGIAGTPGSAVNTGSGSTGATLGPSAIVSSIDGLRDDTQGGFDRVVDELQAIKQNVATNVTATTANTVELRLIKDRLVQRAI